MKSLPHEVFHVIVSKSPDLFHIFLWDLRGFPKVASKDEVSDLQVVGKLHLLNTSK